MDNPSLAQIISVALSLESSVSQANIMSGTVNSIQHESRKRVTNGQSIKSSHRNVNVMCYACGRYGHMKTDRNFPAKERKCRKCKKEGHFEKFCKSKP
ncbi:hypothetical protein DPMN_189597 [Dreissena polymorpha]|uniref:CCHC-type domain-containing protein n=1 Tax=Dreissena polymorpha TaxID=45954 RepID=A0A9D4ICC6_DREPO|nr:hypothetical protein DPMN_189597 [Dreissena polymorpha]